MFTNSLPAELKALDKASATEFISLLEKKWYSHFEALVMLVGEQGTGKTTIARYLIGKGPTRVRKSTNGIGLYTGLSYIDQEEDKWLKGKQDFSKADIIMSRYFKKLDYGTLPIRKSIDSSNQPDLAGTSTTSVQNNDRLGSVDNSLVLDVSEVKDEKPVQANEIITVHSSADEETTECNNHSSRHEDQTTSNTLTQMIPEQTEPDNNSKCDMITRQDNLVKKIPVTKGEPYKNADYKQPKLDDAFAVDSQPFDSLDNRSLSDVSPSLNDHTGGSGVSIQLSNSRYSLDSQHTETLTNPQTVSTLKNIFGVSKDVKKVKVSITKGKLVNKYFKVYRKRLHEKRICPVIIWDFGGQDIFYSTHQIFLSYRAIYLLILDGSRNLDDPCTFTQYLPGKSGQKTARDYLRFWCNTIVTYCKESSNGFPKILIVFTHKDQMKLEEVENRRKQLFKDVSNMFHGSPVMPHLVIGDNIFVNATNEKDPEMHTIQSSIIREVNIHPTQGQKLPRCFIPMELKFEHLIKKKTAVLTFEQLKRINAEHPSEQLTNSELKLFLRFQHAFGKILYFEEPGLDQHIVLLPAYLIDVFKSIITDKSFCKGNKQREEMWDTMSQTGVISKPQIAKIWRKRKYRKFKHDINYFLAVMARLDIIIEPRRYDSKHNRIPTDFYYVASMVQTKDETGYLQSQTLRQRNIAIAFHAPSLIIPPALSFRFIAYWLSIWDVKKDGDIDMLFHRSAIFTIDSSLDAYILCEDETIIIRLVHARNKVFIMSDLASSIGECLASTLQHISQLYTKTSSDTCIADNTTFEMTLCCSASDDPCFISREDLQNIDSIWVCPKHEIGHEKLLLSSWFSRKEETLECSSNCPVTNVEVLNEVPSVIYLRRLSLLYDLNETRELVTHLGLPYSEWSDLFQLETEPEILKFKALWYCHEYLTLTFGKIKNAVETGKIQNTHILCKAFKEKYVDFDTEQEEWNLVPTDEDIDNMAPLIGNKSLPFLVELGMNFQTWQEINHRQQDRDLVKLNRDILNEWKSKFCKTNNIKPTMKKIAQAYKNIGKDVKVIKNTLFS